jgi:hypothetical protein
MRWRSRQDKGASVLAPTGTEADRTVVEDPAAIRTGVIASTAGGAGGGEMIGFGGVASLIGGGLQNDVAAVWNHIQQLES